MGSSSYQDITIVNTDGTEMRDVTYGPVNNPTWSTDGGWLAFESEGDIVVATLDNTERQNLTNSTEYVDRDAAWGS
jgi:Tol biopolymer transport system component